MIIRPYSSETIEKAKKFISPDALLIIVMDALARRKPLSLVRMGDGEKAIALFAQGKPKWTFLNDEKWLTEYGLLGADLKKVGEDLQQAAQLADWFCPNIHGLVQGNYDTTMLCNREHYGEGLFAYSWARMDRVEALMKHEGGVGVVCRNSYAVGMQLGEKYNVAHVSILEYDSWKDYDKCLVEIGKMNANLILCATGASGKFLPIEAATKYGKVVIDVGSALINLWS